MPPFRLAAGPSVFVRPLWFTQLIFATLFGLGTAGAQTVLQKTDTVGASPVAVAVNPATGLVYVANKGSSTVSVIDGASNAIGTITVGSTPSYIVTNPVTNRVYVANTGDATVSVINGATQTVVATLSVGANPTGLAVDPVKGKVYVASQSVNVSIIDASNSVSNVVTGGRSVAVAVNPVTGKVYLATLPLVTGNGSIAVVDGSTNSLSATVSLPFGNPYALAVNPVTNRVYVSNGNGASVAVVSGASNTVSGTINVGTETEPVAVDPVANKIYFGGGAGTSVFVVDGTADTLSRTVTVGGEPFNIAIDSLTEQIYVSNAGSGTVSVIDGRGTATSASATLTVGSSPEGVAVNPVTHRVYVANQTSGSVSVIDGAVNSSSSVSIGSNAFAVALNPVTNKIYICAKNAQNNQMLILDATTNAVSTVTVGNFPYAVAVNPVTNKIYVANNDDGTVSVIDGATQNVTTVTADLSPVSIVVNTVTNKTYVATQNSIVIIDGSNNPKKVAAGTYFYTARVNAATNSIYAVGSNSANVVTVIDGTSDAVTATVPVGNSPQAVAINPVTNVIYVANYGDGTVSVVNGTQNTVTATVAVGGPPQSLVVNPATNRVYVSNVGTLDASVIDGSTNTVIASPQIGNNPTYTLLEPLTNKIYVSDNSGSARVIDGATNQTETLTSVTSIVPAAVNTLTGKVYFGNTASTSLTVLDPYNTQASPLTVSLSPVVDTLTVSTANVFQTTSTTPTFAVNVSSNYSSSSAYGAVSGTTNPTPTAIYYQVDSGSGVWTQGRFVSTSSGSVSFAITTPTTAVGVHTLYVYAVYGDEGSGTDGSSLSGLPQLSNVAAVLFQVDPASTTTLVTSSVNPANVGMAVTFTATVMPAPATGMVKFLETTPSGTTVVLGTYALSGGTAAVTTSFPSTGRYGITATYLGSAAYQGSSNGLNETISSPDATQTTITPVSATVTYAGSQTYTVKVTDTTTSSKTPAGTVSFYDTSIANPLAVLTLSGGQATYIYSPATVSSRSFVATYTPSDSTAFSGSSSNSVTLIVNKATPTVNDTSPPTAYDAAALTLSEKISFNGAAAPTGAVTFYLNISSTLLTAIGTAPCSLAAGATSQLLCQTSISNLGIQAGSYTIVAQYAGDGNYNSNSDSTVLLVTQGTPVISTMPVSIVESSASAILSAQITYTGAAAPTGPVSFSVDSGTSVTGTCTGTKSPLTCTASYAASGLSKGSHTYSVIEAADANYMAASANSNTLTVASGVPICTLTLQSGTPPATGTGIPVGAVTSCTDPNGNMLTPVSLDWGDGTIVNNPSSSNSHPYDVPPGTTKMFTVVLKATLNTLTGMSTQVLTLTAPPAVAAGAPIPPVTATSTPTSQPLKVTFLCTSVTVVYGGVTQATNALPSAYGITCSSQGVVDLGKNSFPVPVTVSTTAERIAENTGEPSLPASRSGKAGTVAYAATGLICLLACMSGRRRKALMGAALCMLCITVSSCGGSFTPPVVTVTHSGTYFVTITEVVTPPPSPPLTNFSQTSLIVKLSVN